MIKKCSALALCILMVVIFASCGQGGEKKSENYVKVENGYALERFEGTSVDKTFTVKDEIDGEPVTELMKFSIANAEYLEEINIGKNVEKIDTWALANCGKLKAINVDKENPYFCSVDGVLFTKDMKTLLAYPNSSHGVAYDKTGAFSSLGSYTVPETVEFIGDHAFYKCNGLGKIVFPSNLKDIGVRAFTRCENLENFELPDTVTRIGEDAFSFCTKLTEMYIPKSVVTIEDYAFFGANTIEKFEMERENENGMNLSSNWLPVKQKSGSLINEKTPVEWNVRRESK